MNLDTSRKCTICGKMYIMFPLSGNKDSCPVCLRGIKAKYFSQFNNQFFSRQVWKFMGGKKMSGNRRFIQGESIKASEISAAGGLEAWLMQEIKSHELVNRKKNARGSIPSDDFLIGMVKDIKKIKRHEGKNMWQESASEHDEQKALFEVFKVHEKKYPELATAFAIPNGGDRHPAVAAKMKAEGVKAGIPDIFIPAVRGNVHGLFVEMKSFNGRTSNDQKKMMSILSSFGYGCLLAKGWENAWREIEKYLKGNDAQLWGMVIEKGD